MVISIRTARKLAATGAATIEAEGVLSPNERGEVFQVVTRHDIQHVDHIKISQH